MRRQSITVENLFKLLALIAVEMGLEDQRANHLDFTSHKVRGHFIANRIIPTEKYADYFSEDPPMIALTYRWDLSFRSLKLFLNSGNIRSHINSLPMLFPTLHFNVFAPLQFLCNAVTLVTVLAYHLFCFCCFLDPPGSLPRNILDSTIWIDIMFNNQLLANIDGELEQAEMVYKIAPWHIVIGTSDILIRGWCVYEIVIRSMVFKRSQIIHAYSTLPDVEPLRIVSSAESSMPSDYFSRLEAFKLEDKDKIKKKIMEIFRNPDNFNSHMDALQRSWGVVSFDAIMNAITPLVIIASGFLFLSVLYMMMSGLDGSAKSWYLFLMNGLEYAVIITFSICCPIFCVCFCCSASISSGFNAVVACATIVRNFVADTYAGWRSWLQSDTGYKRVL